MAEPSTGVTWVNSGLAVLVRDYAGSATDLNPRGTLGSPFALDTALLSIGQLRTENAALQIRVDELTAALAVINADNNQLRCELAAIRIERNTFRAEAMTA
jgi:hypothetical protein